MHWKRNLASCRIKNQCELLRDQHLRMQLQCLRGQVVSTVLQVRKEFTAEQNKKYQTPSDWEELVVVVADTQARRAMAIGEEQCSESQITELKEEHSNSTNGEQLNHNSKLVGELIKYKLKGQLTGGGPHHAKYRTSSLEVRIAQFEWQWDVESKMCQAAKVENKLVLLDKYPRSEMERV